MRQIRLNFPKIQLIQRLVLMVATRNSIFKRLKKMPSKKMSRTKWSCKPQMVKNRQTRVRRRLPKSKLHTRIKKKPERRRINQILTQTTVPMKSLTMADRPLLEHLQKNEIRRRRRNPSKNTSQPAWLNFFARNRRRELPSLMMVCIK